MAAPTEEMQQLAVGDGEPKPVQEKKEKKPKAPKEKKEKPAAGMHFIAYIEVPIIAKLRGLQSGKIIDQSKF